MWSFFSRDPAKDFHYDIGEKIPGLENKSIWSLHHGKKKVILKEYEYRLSISAHFLSTYEECRKYPLLLD